MYANQHFDTPYEAKRKRLIRANGPKELRKVKAKIPTLAKRLTSRPFEKRKR